MSTTPRTSATPQPATASTASTAPPTSSRRVPLDKRKRTETSCDKCKSRKQKCRREVGQDACRYCAVHNIECLTTQPRKKRLYGSIESLGSRLALLEALVKGLLPEANVSSLEEMRQLGSSLGIPLPDSGAGEQAAGSSGTDGDEASSLLPDQQGQVQYIGPSSSFSFHLKLRTLVGQRALREFVLFGKNAADQDAADGDNPLSTPSAASTLDHGSPADRQLDASTVDALIAAYFDRLNLDFPVLHEPSFRETYEAYTLGTARVDPAWVCSFLCVLLLARRIAQLPCSEDQERLWWRRVQTLLPGVLFTSSVTAVQALMLAALHLHNTNHRDACWNLTGTAIRIAFAIGLHRENVNTSQTTLAREVRKCLWWTLYAFEQMQVSSYDRPSAIEHPGAKIGCPDNEVIGMTAHYPPDYGVWFTRILVHLGSACRAPKNPRSAATDESYVGALSPAATVLRDLKRWRDTLPDHLRMDALDTSPPSYQRPLLLLHAMYHYTITVLCRAALLARATLLSKEGKDSSNPALIAMSDACADSGRVLSGIILKLDSFGRFDPVTWCDIWYALASGSILLLDLVCVDKQTGASDMSESRFLLSQLANLASKHGRNTHMPGTLEKFASIVPELHVMAETLCSSPTQAPSAPAGPLDNANRPHHSPPNELSQPPSNPTQHHPPESHRPPPHPQIRQRQQQQHPQHQQHPQQTPPQFYYPQDPASSRPDTTTTPTYMFPNHSNPHLNPQFNPSSEPPQPPDFPGIPLPHPHPHQPHHPPPPYTSDADAAARFDRTPQMNFMDFTIHNIQDWNWADLGSLFGNSVDEAAPPPPVVQLQIQRQQQAQQQQAMEGLVVDGRGVHGGRGGGGGGLL